MGALRAHQPQIDRATRNATVLTETEKGQKIAKNIAEQGSEWALKVLRNEDMGLTVFRTLLEYGRLYGEERDRTGECSSSREKS